MRHVLGERGGSSYGEGGRGMRSGGPTTSQILGPPGSCFSLRSYFVKVHSLQNTEQFKRFITYVLLSGSKINIFRNLITICTEKVRLCPE